jgi:hypothetical protein
MQPELDGENQTQLVGGKKNLCWPKVIFREKVTVFFNIILYFFGMYKHCEYFTVISNADFS